MRSRPHIYVYALVAVAFRIKHLVSGWPVKKSVIISMSGRRVQRRAAAISTKLVNGLAETGKLYNLHIPNGVYDAEQDESWLMLDNEDDGDEDGGESSIAKRFLSFKKSKNDCTTLRLADLQTSRSFVRFLIVLSVVNDLSICGRTMSLRDVYYAEKSHFNSQKQCNDVILSVGKVLGLRRHEMGIVPAARGLVCGLIRFRFRRTPNNKSEEDMFSGSDIEEEKKEEEDSEVAEVAAEMSWMLVAKEQEEESLISSLWTSTPSENIDIQLGVQDADGNTSWYSPSAYEDLSLNLPRHLVVVEKEGIFRRLQEDRFHLHKLPSVLVTGCGFPDVATRNFVTKLCEICPDLTSVGLCDYNPYGMALLLTYCNYEDRRTSSDARKKSLFETAELGVDLQWVGFRSCHIEELQSRLHESAFQPLTARDRQQLSRLSTTSKVLNNEDYLYEVEAMKIGK